MLCWLKQQKLCSCAKYLMIFSVVSGIRYKLKISRTVRKEFVFFFIPPETKCFHYKDKVKTYAFWNLVIFVGYVIAENKEGRLVRL